MNEEQQTELHGQLKGIQLGPKMLACDQRERVFAFALGSGIATSARHAAELAGYTNNPEKSRTGLRSNSLASKAHQVLHRPRVVEAIEEVCRTQFRNLVPLVISAARQVLGNPKHKDHTKMIVSLLSRLGYGETTAVAVDVNMKGEVTVRDTDAAAVADLRKCIEFGLSEEKLIEAFGYSGLGRFRRLMQEEDERNARLIQSHAVEPPGAVEEPAIKYRDHD